MRVAVITDVHGNLHALGAALRDARAEAVDDIVMAGDTVNILPNSKACWEAVTALGCPVLQGNHEYYLYTYGTPAAPLEWQQERFQGLAWLRSQFSDGDVLAMQALPLVYRLPGLLVTHASPRSLFDSALEDTPAEPLREMFAGTHEPLLVRGHNHRWYENRWDGKVLLTVASCGLPLGGRLEPQYLLLERRDRWRYEKRFVAYDHKAALATMDSAYLEHYGPIGKIFRHELRTARGLILPFLAQYQEPIDRGELTLAGAVEQFLS